MSEMIERVARVLYATGEEDSGADQGAWDDLPGAAQEFCRHLARAAIEALRDPAEAQHQAGARYLVDRSPLRIYNSGSELAFAADGLWRAMIDEVLKPTLTTGQMANH